MQKQTSWIPYIWILIILSIVLLFPSLGKLHLWVYDEVRNAECAREMWERNDWLVPTFNGELRALKPPLHYYFMFAGFEMFGMNEWGARFFSAVFGLLTILITYYFTTRYSSSLHSFITCSVLLASTHFLFQFRMSVPDPYLIFLNVLAIFAGYAYFVEKQFKWLLLCAVALALGTLAKGPVAILLPGASLFAWLVWQNRLRQILHWQILVAAFIVVAIAAPWYIAVHYATDGEFTKGFFFTHNLDRFAEPMEGHGGLFIIIPLFVLAGLLPASVFIGESFKNFSYLFKDSFLQLALCVTLLYIIFYSISGTKLPNYPMPCYPFVAIILGYFIHSAINKESKVALYPFIILLVITIALPIGLYFGIKNEVELQGFELHSLFMVILTVGAIVSLLLFRRKGFRTAVLSLMITYSIFNLVFFNYLYPTLYSQNPMTKTINEVKKFDEVVSYKIFHPSYTFYLPERVKVFENVDSLRSYTTNNEVLIISREALAPELSTLELKEVAKHHDLFESHTTILLTNKIE